MDLGENERAAGEDHEKAQDQLDGGTGKTLRRRARGKQGGMDTSESSAGKREANEAGAQPPPAPKCLTLPPTLPENLNIAKDDETKAATATKVPE